MSTIRTDPVTGRKVIIAADRADRPRTFRETGPGIPDSEFCPFCLGNESATPETIATRSLDESASAWDVRVVPNKYPAVETNEEWAEHDDGLYESTSGVGAHEVIIESSRHVVDLTELSAEHVREVIATWQSRIRDLSRDRRLDYALLFKNHGRPAGASIEHAHSQLLALPTVPASVESELRGSQTFHERTDDCVFCRMIEREMEGGERLVHADDEIVVLAPYASRFPFELTILPREHSSTFETADGEARNALAETLLQTLRRLDRAADEPPYNLVVHTAPLRTDPTPHFHWHIELIPTLSHIAGFEWGTGYHINPTPPERAAEHLRDIDLEAAAPVSSTAEAPG